MAEEASRFVPKRCVRRDYLKAKDSRNGDKLESYPTRFEHEIIILLSETEECT